MGLTVIQFIAAGVVLGFVGPGNVIELNGTRRIVGALNSTTGEAITGEVLVASSIFENVLPGDVHVALGNGYGSIATAENIPSQEIATLGFGRAGSCFAPDAATVVGEVTEFGVRAFCTALAWASPAGYFRADISLCRVPGFRADTGIAPVRRRNGRSRLASHDALAAAAIIR